jgi:hypothetical protein
VRPLLFALGLGLGIAVVVVLPGSVRFILLSTVQAGGHRQIRGS